MTLLDAKTNKPIEGGPTFSFRHRAFRAVWTIAWTLLCSWTPRQLYRWRRFVLRAFGATMGANTDVLGSSSIWYPPYLFMEDGALIAGNVEVYNMAPIYLKEKALVSQGAYLCAGTHDYNQPEFPLVTRPITIGRHAWICSRAIVGPGVSVGDGAVLGAGSVTFRSLEAGAVYAGNPAAKVRLRDGFHTPELGKEG